MTSRALPLLVGLFVLAGCSSGANNGASNPTRTTSPAAPTTVATSGSRATPVPAPTQAKAPGGTTSVAAATDPVKAGQADLRAGHYRQAESEFRKAIASGHSDVAAAYAGLGAAATGLKDFKGSLSAYKKALFLSPSNTAYLYGAAYAALYASNFQAAVTYSTRLIRLAPRNAVVYHIRMLAEGHLYLPKQQLKDARQIARLRPNDPQSNNDLGIAFAQNKQYRPALAALSRAIALQPKNYAFYQNRALVENLMKNNSAARADLRRAIPLAPTPQMKRLLAAELRNLK